MGPPGCTEGWLAISGQDAGAAGVSWGGRLFAKVEDAGAGKTMTAFGRQKLQIEAEGCLRLAEL